MQADRFLPGVEGRYRPQRQSHTAADLVSRVRFQRNMRDLLDTFLLLLIDLLFLQWPEARLPLLSRESSAQLLALVNVVAAGYWYFSRIWPVRRAGIIARSWSQAERRRLS